MAANMLTQAELAMGNDPHQTALAVDTGFAVDGDSDGYVLPMEAFVAQYYERLGPPPRYEDHYVPSGWAFLPSYSSSSWSSFSSASSSSSSSFSQASGSTWVQPDFYDEEAQQPRSTSSGTPLVQGSQGSNTHTNANTGTAMDTAMASSSSRPPSPGLQMTPVTLQRRPAIRRPAQAPVTMPVTLRRQPAIRLSAEEAQSVRSRLADQARLR